MFSQGIECIRATSLQRVDDSRFGCEFPLPKFIACIVTFLAARRTCDVAVPECDVPEHVCKRPNSLPTLVLKFAFGKLFPKNREFLAHSFPTIDQLG
jgi:hypothetical protein